MHVTAQEVDNELTEAEELLQMRLHGALATRKLSRRDGQTIADEFATALAPGHQSREHVIGYYLSVARRLSVPEELSFWLDPPRLAVKLHDFGLISARVKGLVQRLFYG